MIMELAKFKEVMSWNEHSYRFVLNPKLINIDLKEEINNLNGSANNNSKDGLHAYSKKADNFRRRLQATGATVGTTELRTMFNNLFQTAV